MADLAKRARTLGGLDTIVEGLIDIFPGMDSSKPETLPPPVRAFLHAVKHSLPFGVVLIAPDPKTGKPTAWGAEVST